MRDGPMDFQTNFQPQESYIDSPHKNNQNIAVKNKLTQQYD